MRSKATDIMFMMIFIILLSLFFGSYGLYSWSVTLDGTIAYHLFYSPLKKINDINRSWGGTQFVEEGIKIWNGWKEFSPQYIDYEKPIDKEIYAEEENQLDKKEEITEIIPPEKLYKGDTLDFLVLGDSLANSIGKQLGPLINSNENMTCLVEGVISSNLIRLDYYDWLSEAPRLAGEAAYDCILIFLGANTMQSFFLEGQRVALFSDEWISIYKERALALLESLDQQQVQVYWMTLPPMQKETYNSNINRLNEIIDEVCLSKGVKRLSYKKLITDGEGKYISEKVVNDKQILLRSDGIHFTREGAEHVSRYLIEQFREIYGLPVIEEIALEDQTTGGTLP